MGYRNYIASIPKADYEKIKNYTKEELYKFKNENLDGYVGVYDVAENELYGFGKYCEFGDEKFFKPVFLNEELQNDFTEEHEFYIVEKEFLRHIIEHYTEKVKTFYSELLSGITNENVNEIPQKKAEEWFAHIRSNASEWLQLTPYNLDKGEEVTGSWKYEYSIFELVRLYKHFDWENNVVIYYGY